MRGPLLALLVLALAVGQAIDIKHALASSTITQAEPTTTEEIERSTRNTEASDGSETTTLPVEVPGDYKPEGSTTIRRSDKILGYHKPENISQSINETSTDRRNAPSPTKVLENLFPKVPGMGPGQCAMGCGCSMGHELSVECAKDDVKVTVMGSAGRYTMQCETESQLYIPEELKMPNFTDTQTANPSVTPWLQCAVVPVLSLQASPTGSEVPGDQDSGGGITLSVQDCWLQGTGCSSNIAGGNISALSITDGAWPLEDMMGLEELGFYYHQEPNMSLPSLSHLALLSLTVSGRSLSLPLALPRTLRRLELSNCGLRRLIAPISDGLDQLEKLYLHGNGLEEVAGDVFTGLSSLRELGVSSNALSVLPVEALSAHCPQLTAVSAFDNAILELGNMTALSQLQELELFYNRVPLSVLPAALSFLPNLTLVDLRESGIRSLPEDLFLGSYSLTELNLAGNELSELPPGLLRNQRRLQTLDLSSNHLQVLPPRVFADLRGLTTLRLEKNQLTEVPSDLTLGLRSLRSLWLSHNALGDVTPATLGGSPDLTTLALDHNRISSVMMFAGAMDNMGLLLNGLRHLEVVNLSSNNLTLVPFDVTSLLSLRSLDLSRNLISSLTDLNYLATNLTVDLTGNLITSVLITPGIIQSDNYMSNNVILLDENPFVCDCFMYHAVRRLKGWIHPDLDKVRLDFGQANCTAPNNLKGTLIVKVREQDLICQTDKRECVEECTCVIRPYTNALEVNCDALPDALPAQEQFGVSATELTLKTIPQNLSNLTVTDIRVLNLSGLAMKEIPLGMPKESLQILDLSNNSLTRVPVYLLTGNLTLKLSQNPLQCDCWYADDIDILQGYSGKVLDYDNVTCVNGDAVRSVSVSQLCAAQRGGIIGGCLALIGILAAVAAVLVIRYRVEVEIVMTRAGLLRRKGEDDDKEYDAFVSYAFEDEDFVFEHLMQRLEGAEGLKLCVHARDWQPGEWISASIEQSIDRSHRTLLVMSRHFLLSRWGRLEFQAAMRQTDATGDRRRVIIILLEDVTHHPEIELDPELKAYLRTNTYVKWGDPWFWRKLLHAMPVRRDSKSTRRPPARSVCAIPHKELLAKVAATELHPADLIMAANNQTNKHTNKLKDQLDCQLNNQTNKHTNKLDCQLMGKRNPAFAKQEELCDKLTDRLQPAIKGVESVTERY